MKNENAPTAHEVVNEKLWIVYDRRAIPRSVSGQSKEYQEIKVLREKKFGKASAKEFMAHFFPGNTDDAQVLVSCESLEEARSYKDDFDGCIYEYDVNDKKELINERFVEVL